MKNKKKLLAVSSSGGHWEQLMLLREAFSSCDVTYVNTLHGLAEKSGVSPFYVVRDCNRNSPLSTLNCIASLARIVFSVRPDIVVSTGAAPGIIAIVLSRFLGAKTIWIDTVSHAEHLSMSGKIACHVSDLWLTQWSHLAAPDGPHYWGNVL